MCGLNAGEACRAGRVVVAWALSESRRGYVFSIAPTITEFSFVSVGLLACLKVNLTPFHNIARDTGRTPSQIAPALHAMAARNGVRARGVIDSAA